MKKCAILLSVIIPLLNACSDPVGVGGSAPEVKALDQDGNMVSLGDAYREGMVLVFFYPRANTRGCTAQACSLRDAYEVLTEKGVTVIGVSSDPPERQKAFRDEHALPFTLLADTGGEVSGAFGVPRRAGFTARQAFLVKQGKVVWRDLSASTTEQANDVLRAIEELGE